MFLHKCKYWLALNIDRQIKLDRLFARLNAGSIDLQIYHVLQPIFNCLAATHFSLFSVKQIPDILCALLSNKRMVLSLEYDMQVGGEERSKGYFNLVLSSLSDKLLSSP